MMTLNSRMRRQGGGGDGKGGANFQVDNAEPNNPSNPTIMTIVSSENCCGGGVGGDGGQGEAGFGGSKKDRNLLFSNSQSSAAAAAAASAFNSMRGSELTADPKPGGGGGNMICGVTCTRRGYFVSPSVEELLLDKMLETSGGGGGGGGGGAAVVVTNVNNFVVGRTNFGRIRFLEPVNVANAINIDEAVEFGHKKVVVYPDASQKPPLGQGLNVPAEIELERVWPTDKTTNEAIKSPAKIKALDYEGKLRRACSRLGAQFLSYNEITGIWKFRVEHFSKYSCELEENEEDEVGTPPPQPPPAAPGLPKKGLGGIPPMAQQQKQKQLEQGSIIITPQVQTGVAGKGHHHHQPGPGGDAPASASSTLGVVRMSSLPSHFTATILPLRPLPPPPPSISQSDKASDDDDDDEDEEENNLEDLLRGSSMISTAHPTHHAPLPKYKPVLKDCGTDKSRLMKRIMSIDEFGEDEENLLPGSTFQRAPPPPPSKRSRPQSLSHHLASFRSSGGPHVEPLADRQDLGQRRKGILFALDDKQVKEKLKFDSTPVRPPPPTLLPAEPIDYLSLKPSSGMVLEDLFASLRVKAVTTSVGLRGCPRVCFGPGGGGHFLVVHHSIAPKGGSIQTQVRINQFRSYEEKQEVAPSSAPFRAVLQAQMQDRLKCQQQNGGGVLFRDHIRTIEAEIKKGTAVPSAKAALEEELVVWQLCDILWPEEEMRDEGMTHPHQEDDDDDGFSLEQRQDLAEWLIKHGALLFGHQQYDPKDTSVLGLMKKGKVEEAANAAVQQGNHTLAVLLASEPHLMLSFEEECQEVLVEGMPEDTGDIYALISGNIERLSSLTPEVARKMSTNEWWQYFALFLWYHGPVKSALSSPVDQAVKEFEELMRTKVILDDECELPATQTSSVANLCMHLLKMYACTGYPMRLILTPRTWTPDWLDYKLAWLLMRDLEEIGYLPEDDELYSSVCVGFTGQLEAIGMWTWSQFVLRHHLPPPETDEGLEEVAKEGRDAFCMRLLEKNLSVEGSRVELEAERFLISELGMNPTEIYSTKRWKSKRTDEQLWILGSLLNRWQECFQLFKTYLLSASGLDLIGDNVPGFSTSMLKHLEVMEKNRRRMIGWEVEGKMVYNYLTMLEEGRKNGAAAAVVQNYYSSSVIMEDALVGFLESVIQFKPSNPNQCAFLLEMALTAQKMIQLVLVDDRVGRGVKERIKGCLVPFLKLPLPKEYFDGLRCFINWNLLDASPLSSPLRAVEYNVGGLDGTPQPF